MRELQIKCETKDSIQMEQLTEFQGKLKELSEKNYKKLRKELETEGFIDPVRVWKQKDKNFILDGHQRLRVMKEMKKEGWKVPKVPIVFVKPRDEKQAKRWVLSLTSQYGRVGHEELYEFVCDVGLDPRDLATSFAIPGISLTEFKKNYFDPEVSGDDKDEETPQKTVEKLTCPNCGVSLK